MLTLIGSSVDAYFTASVIDRTGKVIIPSEYGNIERLSNGFFYLEKLNKENPYKKSFDGPIVDADGKEIAIKLPDSCKLSRVFLPDGGSSKDNNTLPPNTMLEISGARGFALCTPGGKVVLEPEHSAIDSPINGRFPVLKRKPCERTSLDFFVDAKTGKKYPVAINASIQTFAKVGALIPFALNNGIESTCYGYLNTDGKVVIEPKFKAVFWFDTPGMALVFVDRVPKCAYINPKGKIISPYFEHTEGFIDDFAITGRTDNTLKLGLIDRNFKWAIQPKFVNLKRLFANAYAAQEKIDGNWQVISPQGRLLFCVTARNAECSNARRFHFLQRFSKTFSRKLFLGR